MDVTRILLDASSCIYTKVGVYGYKWVLCVCGNWFGNTHLKEGLSEVMVDGDE